MIAGNNEIEKCKTCHQRSKGFFCALSPETIEAFDAIKHTYMYPRGATLFVEGQSAHGIYVLCMGRVKLTVCSREGRTLILRIVEPGEALGLSATILGTPYEMTAETMEPSQANFIPRDAFTQFLTMNRDACANVAQHLSRYCRNAYSQVRSLGLSHSATEKLVMLLLTWCDTENDENAETPRVRILYTREEIARMIGTSRETISRILSDLKQKRIISVEGNVLTILDKAALQSISALEVRSV